MNGNDALALLVAVLALILAMAFVLAFALLEVAAIVWVAGKVLQWMGIA